MLSRKQTILYKKQTKLVKNRIIGIDVARAIAIIGMIIVNFKVVLSHSENSLLSSILSVLDGKAAATFVVLAGVGIALMSNSAIQNNNKEKLQKAKKGIFKRAVFLFLIGLTYLSIWPADILHFYGIYMLGTLILISASPKTIFLSAIALILLYPLSMTLFPYDQNWNFTTLKYSNFWTIKGFLNNLFYNGFHPVLPWIAFMWIGLWFGKKDLHDTQFVKRALWISLIIFVFTQSLSYGLLTILSEGNPIAKEELLPVFGTSPMPPLPLYMISGCSIAIAIISGCILLAKEKNHSIFIKVLTHTGQLALTFYVAHVIIGMGLIEMIQPERISQKGSLLFSFLYSIVFSIGCIIFAYLWRQKFSRGPLEILMRKIVG